MHNLAHFCTLSALFSLSSRRRWQEERQRFTEDDGSCRGLYGICCAASPTVYWAESVVQLYVIAMATKERRRQGGTRRSWKWRIGCSGTASSTTSQGPHYSHEPSEPAPFHPPTRTYTRMHEDPPIVTLRTCYFRHMCCSRC